MELEGNHIEGIVRSKVSRSSSSPSAEESLGLSRVNSGSYNTLQTVLVICASLIWFYH